MENWNEKDIMKNIKIKESGLNPVEILMEKKRIYKEMLVDKKYQNSFFNSRLKR
jgi:hypothetical protein